MTPAITSLTLDAQLAPAGGAAASFARLWQSLWAQPYLEAELLEMCRLTLARLHQDGVELAAGNSRVAAGAPAAARRELLLAGRTDSAAFSPREQAVLAFAERYGLDPQSLTDELAAEVTRHLGEAGLVFLIEALGLLDARIRSARCLRDLVSVGAWSAARGE
jgi:hypothetical protein